MKYRFKIDAADNKYRNEISGRVCPYGVFHFKKNYCDIMFRSWQQIAEFETIKEAKDFYDKIKNLPEYLA